MKYLYNSGDTKERRRYLRKSPTDAERKLWQILRNKQMEGLRFVRQYSVGPYILDFYCPAIRLAIEADGSQHIENEHDVGRTDYLRKKSINVLRFWNNDVLDNIDGVYLKITSTIRDLK
jgi:very-short-patch-repair endonuclease